ncbi:hypothetical protein BSZ39_05170 [Bowdeniella nasicola]|uniref:DUF4333 domain-containing protein n=1 Tax=Bowdeniella nasicola TaxID=208480 RepID=A0A1Q5Q337_9ACTO|nr:DUF4333 domain-containing protein [Bowdeniella nasicola]OKL54227.1 hypothetical protein BSZ39_05170 [Bowdeniella nasicola]
MYMTKLRLAALLTAVGALTACGGTSVKPVPAEELQQRIAESVQAELGEAPAVLCPAGIEAKVGASAQCSISGGTEPLTATAKVTEVNGSSGEVKIAVSVAPDPSQSSPKPEESSPGEDASEPAESAEPSESN